MLTSLLWVAFVAVTLGEAASPSVGDEFLDSAGKIVEDVRSTPAASEVNLGEQQPPGASPAALKETRTTVYEPSPGPVMKLEAGRTPAALQ